MLSIQVHVIMLTLEHKKAAEVTPMAAVQVLVFRL